MIEILAADDHSLVLRGICNIVDAEVDVNISDCVSSGTELIKQLRENDYDLILTDLSMPNFNKMELIAAIRAVDAEVPILVLTMHDDPETAVAAVNQGVSGYLTKSCLTDHLLAAIRSCAAGMKYIEPQLAASIVFEQGCMIGRTPHAVLSRREMQVFRMLVGGGSITRIAEQLHISPKTVSTHKLRIADKLGLRSVSDMVRYAIKHGLIDL